MKVLGMIPARGGSKSIPGKNTRPLAGQSLIERAFRSAAASGALDRIVLSSDDAKALRIADGIGLESITRPESLSRDDTPMLPVALHLLDELKIRDGWKADALMVLQPTSPLRRPEHIQRAVALLAKGDAVCSVIQLPQDLSPHYVMRIRQDGYLDYFLPDGARFIRRQDVPRAYKREGTIFLTRTSALREHKSFYGSCCVPMELEEDESMNIDEPHEWAEAERRLGGV